MAASSLPGLVQNDGGYRQQVLPERPYAPRSMLCASASVPGMEGELGERTASQRGISTLMVCERGLGRPEEAGGEGGRKAEDGLAGTNRREGLS